MVGSVALFGFTGLEGAFFLFDLVEPDDDSEFHDFLL
jgi:hypothetical protein